MAKSRLEIDNLIAAMTNDPAWDNTATGLDTHVWFGLQDDDRDDVFSWIDGSPLEWTYWHDQQPNNIPRQYCGILFKERNAIKWGDVECDKTLPYVCQTGR